MTLNQDLAPSNFVIIVDDSLDEENSRGALGSWGDNSKKLLSVEVTPESIKDQLREYIRHIAEVADTSDTDNPFQVETITCRFALTKNGKIGLAGVLGGDIGNATTIEIQLKRKDNGNNSQAAN